MRPCIDFLVNKSSRVQNSRNSDTAAFKKNVGKVRLNGKDIRIIYLKGTCETPYIKKSADLKRG